MATENLTIEGFEIEVAETQPVVVKAKVVVPKERVKAEEKERFNALLPKSLLERARNAAFWIPNASLTAIVEEGLKLRLDQLEAENGGSYKEREGPLKVGRRKKV